MVLLKSEFSWPEGTTGKKYALTVNCKSKGCIESNNVQATCKDAGPNGVKVAVLSGALLKRPNKEFFSEADAVSQELQGLACMFCDSNGTASRVKHPKLTGDTAAVQSGGFFSIETVEIKPDRKNACLGLRIVHETLTLLKDKWSLVVMIPYPLNECRCEWRENDYDLIEGFHAQIPEVMDEMCGSIDVVFPPASQARLESDCEKVQRHFARLGFVQAGKAEISDARFLTSKMYFGQGDQSPQSALSRWLTKEEASQIEIHCKSKRKQITGLDRELANCIKRLHHSGCHGDHGGASGDVARRELAQATMMFGMPGGQMIDPAVAAERYQAIMQIQGLARRGASIDGSHALHCAAALDFPDGDNFVLKTLVSMGATVDALDELNCTPLHVAAATKRASSIRFLLEVGADPLVGDTADQTPTASLRAAKQSEDDLKATMGMPRTPDPAFDECMSILVAATRTANDTKPPAAKKSRTS